MKFTFKNKRKKKSNKKTILTFFYILYIVLILVFTIPSFTAKKNMEVANDYESNLVFPASGSYGHYKTVELKDENTPGEIKLKYIAESHTLYIQEVTNIKKLVIDCKLMYKNKCNDIFGNDPGKNYYKTFFEKTNKGLFTVSMNIDESIDELQFLDIPKPKSVIVDNIEWWKTEAGTYTLHKKDITINDIPSGTYVVKIYFKKVHFKNPSATFTVSKDKAKSDEVITFDASKSKDKDGEIIAYLWDFGDNNDGSGIIATHSYSVPGTYKVTLTVRDNDFLEDIYKKTIEIKEDKDKKCKGLASMTVSYTGGKDADIIVKEGTVTDNEDGTYTITPKSGKSKLGANTKIYIDNKLAEEIHTSCSKPTNVDDVHGDFTIVALEKIY